MSDEGEGKPPVVILREETNVTSGTEVQEKLIAAARVFADLLRPTFGPRGLDKMLYKTDGTTAVTNDGAKIVAELMVKHPAAKMFVAMAESQENTCGDGVTGTMLLSAELLIEGERLLKKGLHPLMVIAGYEKACNVSLTTCSNLVENIADDADALKDVARTSLTGKGAEGASDILTELIVSSLLAVKRTDATGALRCEAEDVSMDKIGHGDLRDSRLLRGVIMRRRILLDALPNHIEDARVAILNGDIALRKQKRTAEIEIEEVEQLEAFLDAEETNRDTLANSLLESGANVFLCSGEVDKGILHRLMRSGCFAAGGLDDRELRNAALATGATIMESGTEITPGDLGQAGVLTAERRAVTEKVEDLIRLEECPEPHVVTCEIGGANDLAAEEAIRALHDALRSTSLAIKDGRVLHGGGATHMACALAIREAAEHEAGRERLAMEAFARALEVIPSALAQNAGTDSLDRLLELRAAHRNGVIDAGIKADGSVGPTGARISALSLECALSAATETCSSMLRIDQVISARGD